MLGAIFGDVVGSVYEFDNIKTKDFPLFKQGCGYTDDSVMTVATAEALMRFAEVADVDAFKQALIEAYHKYGNNYPYAGYGIRFFKWLATRSTEPYGSYGNGSAMRVSPVAWYATSLEEAISLARASAEITHDHPEGIKGAVVTAGATYLARTGESKDTIRAFAERFYDMSFTLDEIRPTYFFNETCQDTVPQAIEAFLESESFEDAIRNGISLGGDSDTLCAITGAVAEGYYGMSDAERGAALSHLDEPMRRVTIDFLSRVGSIKEGGA